MSPSPSEIFEREHVNGNGGIKFSAFGLKISLNKKALAWILAILLPSGITGGLTFRGPIIAWFVTPAIEAKSAEIQATILPLERHRTDSLILDSTRPIIRKMDRIQAVLEEMPEGQRAIHRLIHRKDARISMDSIH